MDFSSLNGIIASTGTVLCIFVAALGMLSVFHAYRKDVKEGGPDKNDGTLRKKIINTAVDSGIVIAVIACFTVITAFIANIVRNIIGA